MNKPSLYAACLLAGSWLLPGSVSAGEEPAADLAGWQSLTYEGSRFGFATRIEIELLESSLREMNAEAPRRLRKVPLQTDPAQVALMHIIATGSRNYRSEVHIWFDPATGAVLQRVKLRGGSDPVRKIYRFSAEAAHRIKQRPESPQQAREPPARWSRTKRSSWNYDLEAMHCDSVTDPALLLYLLSREGRQPADRVAARCSFFDDTLYRVSFDAPETVNVQTAYRLGNGENPVQVRETRRALDWTLQVTPITPGKHRDDFELFELRGDIVVTIDAQNGLPLQLSGERSIPLAGKVRLTVPLTEAVEEATEPR